MTYTKSKSSEILENANLLKKYHTNLVYDYTEYPTKGHWSEKFGSDDYQSAIKEWYSIKENTTKPVLFYVHTPFCEQLCYFCLCSKVITSNYDTVKDYLYNHLSKEFDLLEKFLNKNNIKLNFKEIYLGGGSPTYYKEEEFIYVIVIFLM